MDGERAFKFYFPVLDRYLRGVEPQTEPGYSPAWFVACAIQMHFDCHEDMTGLHEQIISLCDYVLSHLGHFTISQNEQHEIESAWTNLRNQVADDARGIRKPRR